VARPELERILAAGSLAVAVGGLLAPGLLGWASGLRRTTARLLALRDLAIAAALFGPRRRAGLVARGVSDLGDAVLVARRRPWLAVLAASAGVVSLAAALDDRRSERWAGSAVGGPAGAWAGAPMG
jgi:hypothetical protein